MDEYIKELKRHDWFYAHSDDGSVYRAGERERSRLRSMRESLDPTGEVWNQHCPPEFAIRPVTQKQADEAEAKEKPRWLVEDMYPGCNKKMLDVLRKVNENDHHQAT